MLLFAKNKKICIHHSILSTVLVRYHTYKLHLTYVRKQQNKQLSKSNFFKKSNLETLKVQSNHVKEKDEKSLW